MLFFRLPAEISAREDVMCAGRDHPDSLPLDDTWLRWLTDADPRSPRWLAGTPSQDTHERPPLARRTVAVRAVLETVRGGWVLLSSLG